VRAVRGPNWRVSAFGYFDFALSCVEGQSFIASVLERDDSTTATLVATIVFLPLLFIALTGGLLAITLARLAGVRHRQQPAIPLTRSAGHVRGLSPGS
jgi:hypothetical protein